MMSAPTFLVIGASGLTGTALLRAAAAKAPTHAFVRTPSKLSTPDVRLCVSIQRGDALNAIDIENALDETGADIILLSVGVASSVARSTLREMVGRALVTVLNKTRFRHVRAVVIGAFGAGGTHLEYGWGIGKFAEWTLRHVLEDHDRQEKILMELRDRCWIIRPVMLGNHEGDRIVEFEGKAPTIWVGRKALGEWIVDQILEGLAFGHPVNVAALK